MALNTDMAKSLKAEPKQMMVEMMVEPPVASQELASKTHSGQFGGKVACKNQIYRFEFHPGL